MKNVENRRGGKEKVNRKKKKGREKERMKENEKKRMEKKKNKKKLFFPHSRSSRRLLEVWLVDGYHFGRTSSVPTSRLRVAPLSRQIGTTLLFSM